MSVVLRACSQSHYWDDLKWSHIICICGPSRYACVVGSRERMVPYPQEDHHAWHHPLLAEPSKSVVPMQTHRRHSCKIFPLNYSELVKARRDMYIQFLEHNDDGLAYSLYVTNLIIQSMTSRTGLSLCIDSFSLGFSQKLGNMHKLLVRRPICLLTSHCNLKPWKSRSK